MVIRGTIWLQTVIHVRESKNYSLSRHIRLLDEAARLDAIIIDFSKAFDLVRHDRLLKN